MDQHTRCHAELFQESGQAILSPSRMANAFRIDLPEFAAALGVHISTLRLQPENPKAQAIMRGLNRVILCAVGDRARRGSGRFPHDEHEDPPAAAAYAVRGGPGWRT